MGKRVLVTGNTGFKGAWLTTWLIQLGAEVHGLANGVPTSPSIFVAANHAQRITYWENDVTNLAAVGEVLATVRPDFLFHLAAQPLVRAAYEEPASTFQTNVIGTINVLDALRMLNLPCVAVMITSDKAYDNVEWVWGYRETDPLGGKDPYSASKGAAELAIRCYFKSYFARSGNKTRIAVGRAGNVIGGGDWAKDRIVPDAMRAWTEGRPIEVRSISATRPWQHVLEPLSGYLALAQRAEHSPELNGEPFNFGPSSDANFTVGELLTAMQRIWPSGKINATASDADKAEARLLKLNCDKALSMLEWRPALTFQETAELVVKWYQAYYANTDSAWSITNEHIRAYTQCAATRGIKWALA